MTDASPIEALQREIDSNLLLPHQTRRPQRVLCALLELAIADAELVAETDPELWPARQESIECARTKLYEALQK